MKGAWRKSRRIVSDLPGDLRHGISTGLLKPDLGHADGEAYFGYEPVPYTTLRDIRQDMASRAVARGQFVDIGCGWARPLYYFADRFDALTGYEVNPRLFAKSAAQLRHAQRRRPIYRKIALHLEDGITANVYSQGGVLFMYNPFGPEPMRRLAGRLRQSSQEFHIYYVNPLHFDVLQNELGVTSREFSTFMKVRHFHLPPGDSTMQRDNAVRRDDR